MIVSRCATNQPPPGPGAISLPPGCRRKTTRSTGGTFWPSRDTSTWVAATGCGAGRPAAAKAAASVWPAFTLARIAWAVARARSAARCASIAATICGLTWASGSGAAGTTLATETSAECCWSGPTLSTVGWSSGAMSPATFINAVRVASGLKLGSVGAVPSPITGGVVITASLCLPTTSLKVDPALSESSIAASRAASASSFFFLVSAAAISGLAWSSERPAVVLIVSTWTMLQPSGVLIGAAVPPCLSAKAALATSAEVWAVRAVLVRVPSAISAGAKPASVAALSNGVPPPILAAKALALASSGSTTCETARVSLAAYLAASVL